MPVACVVTTDAEGFVNEVDKFDACDVVAADVIFVGCELDFDSRPGVANALVATEVGGSTVPVEGVTAVVEDFEERRDCMVCVCP